MNLAELIYKRFVDSGSLTKHLSQYAGYPAVFSQEPPEDEQEGWNGITQYPRIVYNFDLQANEERNSAGTLAVSLICQNTGQVSPEDIGAEIKMCLKDVLLKTDSDVLYAFAWAKTEDFTMPDILCKEFQCKYVLNCCVLGGYHPHLRTREAGHREHCR